VLKAQLNQFSHTQNTPKTSREGNQMIFSKEEQSIDSYWRFLNETKEKRENISLTFSSCNHFHPSDPQPNTLYCSLRELVEYFQNDTQPSFLGEYVIAFRSYPKNDGDIVPLK